MGVQILNLSFGVLFCTSTYKDANPSSFVVRKKYLILCEFLNLRKDTGFYPYTQILRKQSSFLGVHWVYISIFYSFFNIELLHFENYAKTSYLPIFQRTTNIFTNQQKLYN